MSFLGKKTVFLGLLLMLLGCSNEQVNKQYLFLGHCYDWGPNDHNRIDERLDSMDFTSFDQIWLGGDLCVRTSKNEFTLQYLDSVLFIGSEKTHWTLGNHDLQDGSLSRIASYTRKPSFYSRSFDDLVLFVMNTSFNHPQLGYGNDWCESVDRQYQLIAQVCDTIADASHLVVIHHHNLLTNALTENQYEMKEIAHYYYPQQAFRCTPKETFEEAIYPLLEQVQKKGIQVILIAGDYGQRHKGFQYQTKEGIWFLGSGINNSMGEREVLPYYVTNTSPDSILIFTRNTEEKTLKWKFHEL